MNDITTEYLNDRVAKKPTIAMETLDPRRALQVTRYHTWPRVREQSIGEHSMQVMRILLAIWPAAPRHMLIHCMKHDLGETLSGDPPYPIKALNTDLKIACDRIESEAVKLMEDTWMIPLTQELSVSEKLVFKLAEFLEMAEWGMYEVWLGNSMARVVIDRCMTMVDDHLDRLNKTDLAGVVSHARRYIARRVAMFNRLEPV